MRPNQQEGVQWLRKAAESASLQIADEEEHIKEGKAVDYLERKTRKAQFALSIYELGVSHMNGWGIEQDKALALRCFEIAGCTFPQSEPLLYAYPLTMLLAWGDVDALAEAGFCYAQGIGCRKNLRKAAGFYRQAEAKGMSMVGNSWYVRVTATLSRCYGANDRYRIHKAKYNPDPKKDDKGRSKSKARKTIFGIKSSSNA
jgi:TPR repeat protein